MLAKRLFLSGLIVTCLFAFAHFGGFLQAIKAARNDPDMKDLTQAMRDHKTNVFGYEPSILDFHEYFGLNFSILLLLAAVLGFVAISITPSQSALIRQLSLIYVVAMITLLGTSMYFSVFQGIITCLIIAVLFGLSWWFA
jgi:hypothetical protein